MKKTEPTDAMQAFFRVVRFGAGRPEWVNKARHIVNRFDYINKDHIWVYSYVNETMDLYKSIAEVFGTLSSEEKMNTFSNISAEGEEFDDSFDEGEVFEGAEVEGKGRKVKSIVREVFERNFDSSWNKEMIKDILPIITNFNKKNCGGSAMASYSGVINPRNVARGDYKFFDRKAQERGVNKFGSVHLNLFLDESGSFCSNESKANQLISALAQAEKIDKNFSFDIVYCGMGERLVKDKHHRTMKCGGGNDLDVEIFNIYRRLQKLEPIITILFFLMEMLLLILTTLLKQERTLVRSITPTAQLFPIMTIRMQSILMLLLRGLSLPEDIWKNFSLMLLPH